MTSEFLLYSSGCNTYKENGNPATGFVGENSITSESKIHFILFLCGSSIYLIFDLYWRSIAAWLFPQAEPYSNSVTFPSFLLSDYF